VGTDEEMFVACFWSLFWFERATIRHTQKATSMMAVRVRRTGKNYSPPFLSLHSEYLIRHGPHRKHRVKHFFCCCVCVCCRGNVFTEPLNSNVREGHRHTDRNVIS
jgi:hypothetical protein